MFVQFTWLEHTTKLHWECSPKTQYRIQWGKTLFKILKGQNINGLNILSEIINIFYVTIWFRNNKVIKYVLVTLEVPK